jgi:hypothetical protein
MLHAVRDMLQEGVERGVERGRVDTRGGLGGAGEQQKGGMLGVGIGGPEKGVNGGV